MFKVKGHGNQNNGPPPHCLSTTFCGRRQSVVMAELKDLRLSLFWVSQLGSV